MLINKLKAFIILNMSVYLKPLVISEFLSLEIHVAGSIQWIQSMLELKFTSE